MQQLHALLRSAKAFWRGHELGQKAAAAAAVCIWCGVLQLAGINCPIKYFTGVSCAGCGMTRALLATLRLDFKAAFTYHPLFFTVPVMLLLICFGSRLPRRVRQGLLAAFLALFFAVYLYRMLCGTGDIVVFAPQTGALFRLAAKLLPHGG